MLPPTAPIITHNSTAATYERRRHSDLAPRFLSKDNESYPTLKSHTIFFQHVSVGVFQYILSSSFMITRPFLCKSSFSELRLRRV